MGGLVIIRPLAWMPSFSDEVRDEPWPLEELMTKIAHANPKPKRFLRRKEILKRLAVGRTTLEQHYIKPGKLKMVHLGPRCVGALESHVEELIDQIVAEDDAKSS